MPATRLAWSILLPTGKLACPWSAAKGVPYLFKKCEDAAYIGRMVGGKPVRVRITTTKGRP